MGGEGGKRWDKKDGAWVEKEGEESGKKKGEREGGEREGKGDRERVKTGRQMTVVFMFQVSSKDSRLPKDTSASPHSGPSHIPVLV